MRSLLVLLVSGLLGLGCFASDTDTGGSGSNLDSAGDDDENGYDGNSDLCVAAEDLDDACEDIYGDDPPECAAFDAVNEDCEHDRIVDACATAEQLDDDCEALYGEDADECAGSDAVDEACEAAGYEDAPDGDGDPEDD